MWRMICKHPSRQMTLSHTCQPVQFTSIKYSFSLFFGGEYGHTGKRIQENISFMRFCCCFKLSKKIQKLSNELPTNTIAECTLCNRLRNLVRSEIWSHACIFSNIASSFHCHTCRLEFKTPLLPAKNQKTPACIREIHVHKLWTKVYSQKGLTAMLSAPQAI